MSTEPDLDRVADIRTTAWRLVVAAVLIWPLAIWAFILGVRLTSAQDDDGAKILVVAVVEIVAGALLTLRTVG